MASDRTRYHLVPHADGWAVEKEHADRALKVFSTKDEATAWAVETAKAHKPSQVLVHGQDGKIQTEWTYGDDPYPPPG